MILPSEFTTRIRRLLDDEYDLLEQALQTNPPVSIRLNPSKKSTLFQHLKQYDTSFRIYNTYPPVTR